MPMRSRFRLWLKKRGGRRTGTQRAALSGELLYHSVFVVVGAVALWLHVANVLLPSARSREDTASFREAQCEIVSRRIDIQRVYTGYRFSLSEGRVVRESHLEYRPECHVQLLVDERPAPPVWAPAGGLTPSERAAESALARFQAGQTYQCWVDLDDPQQIVLARPRLWWPWLVTLIPLSLIVLGVVGGARSVLRVGVSRERRQSVAQRARGWESLLTPTSPTAGAALPDLGAVIDSPGVRLPYRLPTVGDSPWRVAGMAAICVAWNLLVGFFLIGLVMDHLSGEPNWTLTVVVAPLALTGVYLAAALVRDARTATGVGVTHVEVSDHPLLPGRTYRGVVIQAGQFLARSLTVSLVCEEEATYLQGTNTRTSTELVYRDAVLRERRLEVTAGKACEEEFSFTIPAGAMHSFSSPHNEVRWALEVRGTPVRWPEFRRRFMMCVYPTALSVVPHTSQHTEGAAS